MKAACPECGRVHPSDCVRAVGRFDDGATVYAARLPEALVRQTRAEAESDWCRARAGKRPKGKRP